MRSSLNLIIFLACFLVNVTNATFEFMAGHYAFGSFVVLIALVCGYLLVQELRKPRSQQ